MTIPYTGNTGTGWERRSGHGRRPQHRTGDRAHARRRRRRRDGQRAPRACRRGPDRARIEAPGRPGGSHIADVTDPAAVIAHGRGDGRALRTDRRAREQCRDPAGAAVRAMSFADWRRVLAVILDGAFLCAQAVRAPHRARRRRLDRQHRRRDRAPRCRGPRARRDGEGRARGPDQGARPRSRAAADHRQLRRARPHRHGARRVRRTRRARTRPAVPPIGRLGRPKRWPRWCACCADPTPATSPDRRSMSTAAVICRDAQDFALVGRTAARHPHPR